MENLEYPLISVIMPTFNREKYIKFAIESILNQTFTSFEFIIIDDCSNDATYDIIREYAKIDQRIIVLRNKANKGIVFSLNKGLQLSRGKYIARMDDDDISMPTRLEKQFQIMEKDDSIIVAGTYFKYIGRNPDFFASWVNVYEHDMVKIKMMFECPICHPSVIMRKNFFKKYNLKYSQEYQYAEDYKLWLDVLQNGGKIINIPEILLLYRATNLSISRNKKTSNLQQIRSRSILFKCRELFLDTKSKNLLRDFCNIPMELSKKQEIYKKIQRIQIAYQGNRDSVQKILQYFCGVFSDIHICFIFDNIQLQGLINGIFSILKNSSELDRFHFYILHNGSFQSEFSILKLRRIKDFELSIIDICKINNENISQYKTLYFKFLFALTQLKIEKCLLISSRFVVMDSLNFFWNADFEKKIIVATSSCNLEKMELFRDEFLIQENFESNVIMINLEYLLKNNFLKEILFYDKTFYFHNEILSKEEIIM
ncbi:glycosyltransferase family 2 protein, partial [Campylobacter jejuni]|nr:glycosyltransferase family 2 protein [Campylobacter jejuni]